MEADPSLFPTVGSKGKVILHSLAQCIYMQQHASKLSKTQSILLFDWHAEGQAKRQHSGLL